MAVIRRILGRTGLNVSEIGFGIEHVRGERHDKIVQLVRAAIAGGISYFDLVWSLPAVLKGIADGIDGQRKNVQIAVHLGSGHMGGRYRRTRKPDECEKFFEDALQILGTEHADIANVHYVQDVKVWREVKEQGIVDLAVQLKESGRSRAVGISTHDPEVVKLAVDAKVFDVVTFQVNMASHDLPGRSEALRACAESGVGVVAMKPFAGGKLLQYGKRVKIPKYQTGGYAVEVKVPAAITPARCLNYILSQQGVCTTIPGVSNADELHTVLAYQQMSRDEKDYSVVLKELLESQRRPERDTKPHKTSH